ncbi:hypothetical protein PIB30_078141 [Stylosanthes scabra]|uniref:Uncharacterized protein n=1 Tax=Stylosanthes scabra TaxID=79078 RepID=A0ABU6XNR4_9FABA|nr:hypothetical protein [Stylosanthes scabra]
MLRRKQRRTGTNSRVNEKGLTSAELISLRIVDAGDLKNGVLQPTLLCYASLSRKGSSSAKKKKMSMSEGSNWVATLIRLEGGKAGYFENYLRGSYYCSSSSFAGLLSVESEEKKSRGGAWWCEGAARRRGGQPRHCKDLGRRYQLRIGRELFIAVGRTSSLSSAVLLRLMLLGLIDLEILQRSGTTTEKKQAGRAGIVSVETTHTLFLVMSANYENIVVYSFCQGTTRVKEERAAALAAILVARSRVRGGIGPMPLGMGEALVVGGCRPSHTSVGHDTQPLHECRGGGGRGVIGGSRSDAGQGHGIGPLGGDAGCPRGTGRGGGAVGDTRDIGAPVGALVWGKNSNMPWKGTRNMAGQQGEEQLECDADINRLDRTHHVAGAIGFQVSTVDLSRYKHVGLRQWRRSREPSEWVELGIYNGEWRGKFDPVIVPLNISRLNERRSILQGNAMAEI